MMTRKQCMEIYGSDYYIRKHMETGELFRLDKDIYSEEENVPELAVLSYKYPEAVVTMNTAFYIYGLTDAVPDEYDMATTRNASKIPDKRVRQFFVVDEFFANGVDVIDYKGYDINIYNKERMLVELLRYKSKLSFDYYKEIVLNYRKILPQLDIQKIQDYAIESPKSGRVLDLLQAEVM